MNFELPMTLTFKNKFLFRHATRGAEHSLGSPVRAPKGHRRTSGELPRSSPPRQHRAEHSLQRPVCGPKKRRANHKIVCILFSLLLTFNTGQAQEGVNVKELEDIYDGIHGNNKYQRGITLPGYFKQGDVVYFQETPTKIGWNVRLGAKGTVKGPAKKGPAKTEGNINVDFGKDGKWAVHPTNLSRVDPQCHKCRPNRDDSMADDFKIHETITADSRFVGKQTVCISHYHQFYISYGTFRTSLSNQNWEKPTQR